MTEDARRKEHIGDPLNPRVFITNESRDHATYTPDIIPISQALANGTALLLDTGRATNSNKGPKYSITLTSVPRDNQPDQEIRVVTHGDLGKIETVKTTLTPNPGCNNCGGSLTADTVEGEPLVPQVSCPHCQKMNPAIADPVTITEDVAFFKADPFHKTPDKVWTPEEVQDMFTFLHRTNRYIQKHVLAFMDQSQLENPIVNAYDISRYDESALRNLFIQTEKEPRRQGNPARISEIRGVKMEEPDEEEEFIDEINIFEGYSQADTRINDLYNVHEIKSPQGQTYKFLTEWDGDEAINIIIKAADLVGSGWVIEGTLTRPTLKKFIMIWEN
jgi:hypothetical protein